MTNIPEIKLGIVAVSRDCFPVDLSRTRRDRVVEACAAKKINISVVPTVVENEKDVLRMLGVEDIFSPRPGGLPFRRLR